MNSDRQSKGNWISRTGKQWTGDHDGGREAGGATEQVERAVD